MTADDLSLAELEAFDPGYRRGTEQRFCCPLPACAGKTRSKAHRSVSVNAQTGAWKCHRCGAAGILREFRAAGHERPNSYLAPYLARAAAARRAYSIAPDPPPASPTPPAEGAAWQAQLQGAQPISGTPGERYLCGRGIARLFAAASGVLYHPRWYGRGPAVVFPIRDQAGALAAAQGRFLQPSAGVPKAMTAGPVRHGVFATPDLQAVWEAPAVLVTEAPIDALSLMQCGYPALALIGTHFPDWLPAACFGHRVLIATDADQAGDSAAGTLCNALEGLRCERLKPIGAKDWNEMLQRGGQAHLTAILTRFLPHPGQR